MDSALERIGSFIRGFAGYADAERRRVADEQIRAFVGEMLAELPAVEIDGLPDGERAHYDRVLLRCEFVNQDVFRIFDTKPTPQRLAATLNADLELVEAASALSGVQSAELDGLLVRLSAAFDVRDAAMQST
jgi:hypothetical protein